MPDTQNDTDTPTTLGEFLAQQAPDDVGTALQRLLVWLASAGGHAFVTEAKRAGHGETVMLAGLGDDPEDRRIKARLKAAELSGDQVIWLTTPGWKAAGHPSKREVRPTTQTFAHADAPRTLRTWVAGATKVLGGAASVEVLTDPTDITTISEAAKARAWARVRGMADSEGGIGALTSGLRPDALVVERWWNASAYLAAYNLSVAADPEEYAEVVWAVEIEDTTKSVGALKEKILRLDAAVDVGVVRGTIWVTRTAETARALAAFGIGRDQQPRPGHYVLRGWQLGLPGDFTPPAGPAWWPLRLTTTPKPIADVFTG